MDQSPGRTVCSAEPVARCEPRVVLFLAGLSRVIQIRRRPVLALRPCGGISKVVALPQGERIITLRCIPTGRQDVLRGPSTEISLLRPTVESQSTYHQCD
jgi:hypothetical protein